MLKEVRKGNSLTPNDGAAWAEELKFWGRDCSPADTARPNSGGENGNEEKRIVELLETDLEKVMPFNFEFMPLDLGERTSPRKEVSRSP